MYNKVMNKILSLMVAVILLLLCLPNKAMALEFTLQSYSHRSDVDDMKVLDNASPELAQMINDADSISYEYDCAVDNDATTMDIQLDVSIVNGVDINHILAGGSMEICEDLNGRKYVNGPLDGYATIDGKEYIACIGLQKFVAGKDIFASIVLQDVNNYDIALAGHFGPPICTAENIDTSASFSGDERTESQVSDVMPMAAGDYTLVTSKKTGFSGTSISGFGQELTVRYSSYYQRIIVSTKSFPSTVTNYFEQNAGSLESISTGVDRFSIELTRNSSQDPSYIVGIERDTNIFPSSKAPDVIRTVLGVAFDALGLGSGALDAFFTGINPTKEETPDATNYKKIGYSTSMGSFNISQTGAPIVFQMNTTQTATGRYTAKTTLRYKVLYMEVSGNMPTYFVNAADASAAFSVNFVK